jgi:hypothetical protein
VRAIGADAPVAGCDPPGDVFVHAYVVSSSRRQALCFHVLSGVRHLIWRLRVAQGGSTEHSAAQPNPSQRGRQRILGRIINHLPLWVTLTLTN